MGLMDKVKQQAEQALAKAQQGVSQGQAKLDQVQAKRQADALLRNLGAAYYAKERHGGPQEAVDTAMKMLDEHVEAHGPIDTSAASATAGQGGAATSGASASPPPDASASASPPPDASAPASPPSPPSPPQTGATAVAGNFSIDDV